MHSEDFILSCNSLKNFLKGCLIYNFLKQNSWWLGIRVKLSTKYVSSAWTTCLALFWQLSAPGDQGSPEAALCWVIGDRKAVKALWASSRAATKARWASESAKDAILVHFNLWRPVWKRKDTIPSRFTENVRLRRELGVFSLAFKKSREVKRLRWKVLRLVRTWE